MIETIVFDGAVVGDMVGVVAGVAVGAAQAGTTSPDFSTQTDG